MAEDDINENEDGTEEGDGEDSEGGKKRGGKKLVMIIAPLVLIIGGLAAAYFMGALDGLLGKEDHEEPHAEGIDGMAQDLANADDGSGVYFDITNLVVTLNSNDPHNPDYLSLDLSIRVASADDVTLLENNMPRIRHNFNSVLRELRLEETQGSSGYEMIKEELLRRLRVMIPDADIREVLIVKFLPNPG